MYYEYWNLKKPPFDNVPDPSMYVECHASMENAIAETLFAIEEGGECMAVIVGDVGLGKTLSLRMIIDSLDQEKYKIALITNPSITFVQLVKEIIGQLTGTPCDESRKVNLLEAFNRILFETVDEGKKVLIFIDEGNAISPANLESLRLLTNMQDDQRNLFTMVLAGQIELARRLEHPKRANLFQRIGTYNRIDKISSEELVKTYVEARIRLAGGTSKIFTDDAFAPLWKHSEHGIPRLINKVCKLCLKAGETNGFEYINGDVVDQIGQRFQRVSGPAMPNRKSRRRILEDTAKTYVQDATEQPEEVPVRGSEETGGLIVEKSDTAKSANRAGVPVSISESMSRPEGEEMSHGETLPFRNALPRKEESVHSEGEDRGESDEVRPFMVKPKANVVPISPEALEIPGREGSVETEIGGIRITVDLPSDLVARARSLSSENRLKLAGALAARAMRGHSEVTTSQVSDPVHMWGQIREFVLSMFGEEKGSVSCRDRVFNG